MKIAKIEWHHHWYKYRQIIISILYIKISHEIVKHDSKESHRLKMCKFLKFRRINHNFKSMSFRSILTNWNSLLSFDSLNMKKFGMCSVHIGLVLSFENGAIIRGFPSPMYLGMRTREKSNEWIDSIGLLYQH